VRVILKGPEPLSLITHRQTRYCSYDNYLSKDDLRHALISEQRGLCCYCIGRIHNGPTTMKIEHWKCQTRYPTEQLNYKNLMATCPGGAGLPERSQHCDTKKGDKDLNWNPAEPDHHIETRLRYEADGTIRSDDVEFDTQLNNVLNLNLPLLKSHRKGVLTSILEWWKREKDRIRGPIPRDQFERERNRYIRSSGHLTPYCQVAVWWLQQRLAKMT
jgi:uncharacterized protein (TIGR02646 family)